MGIEVGMKEKGDGEIGKIGEIGETKDTVREKRGTKRTRMSGGNIRS